MKEEIVYLDRVCVLFGPCLPFRTRILVCEKCPFPSVFLWATKSAFSIQYLFDGSLCFLSTGKQSYSQCSYFIEWTIHPHNREFLKSQLCTLTLIFRMNVKSMHISETDASNLLRDAHEEVGTGFLHSLQPRVPSWGGDSGFASFFLQLKTTSKKFRSERRKSHQSRHVSMPLKVIYHLVVYQALFMDTIGASSF